MRNPTFAPAVLSSPLSRRWRLFGFDALIAHAAMSHDTNHRWTGKADGSVGGIRTQGKTSVMPYPGLLRLSYAHKAIGAARSHRSGGPPLPSLGCSIICL